ncbi:MAG: hypothetical protein HC822_21985, partial [Oscillochloris sp.]|nr:hypothetical protein [Oscillochloris sp.]
MADVRINEVSTSVNVTDASAMLTPQVLQRMSRRCWRNWRKSSAMIAWR